MEPFVEMLRRVVADWSGGLPTTTAAKERAGAIGGAAATLWMLLVAAWGVNGVIGDGHTAAIGAIGVAGDNMWRHHTVYPLTYYLPPGSTPSGPLFYMHHPLGVFWVTAVFLKIFGAHNWVLRLPAVLYSTATTALLYRLGRAIWGPLEAALTALAFVSLPIALGFAAFHSLEVPVIFGLVLASWGYARLTQTWRLRYALLSVLGFVWALNYEWSGYVWGILFVGAIFGRVYLLPPRWFRPVDARAFGRYWSLMVIGALATLVVQLGLLLDTGKLMEIFTMYTARSSGNALPLGAVLQSRHVWIELMYPGLAIVLGKLAVPVVVLRFLRKRDELELFPLLFLALAAFHYVVFKQGADIHIFWSHHFATFFALGVGALAATSQDLVPRALGYARGRLARLRPHAPWIAAGIVALPLAFVLRDGAWMIRLGQESGLRFNSTNIKSDIDRIKVVQWGARKLKPEDPIAFHGGIAPIHGGLSWELRPRQLFAGQPVGARGASPRLYHLDTRYASVADLRLAARTFHVEAVGPLWTIDRAAAPAPLDGYDLDEREPGLLEWYFTSGTEPARKVAPDPWVTWEWRTLLDQPAPALPPTPTTTEQVRVAHNAAVAAGDKVGATRWRAELDKRLDVRVTAKFDDDTLLLGAHHNRGAEHSLTVYFLAGPKGTKGGAKFVVYAQVTKRSFLSTLAEDHDRIEVDMPFAVPTELWRPGHVYSMKFTYRHRPGTERLFGTFVSLDGRPAPARAGGGFVDLVTL
jgi:hypothetical protein